MDNGAIRQDREPQENENRVLGLRHVQVEVITAVSAEGWTQGVGMSHSLPSGEDGETTEQRRLRSGRRAREGPGEAGPGKVAEEVKLTNVKCRGQLACRSYTRSDSCPYHCGNQ